MNFILLIIGYGDSAYNFQTMYAEHVIQMYISEIKLIQK